MHKARITLCYYGFLPVLMSEPLESHLLDRHAYDQSDKTGRGRSMSKLLLALTLLLCAGQASADRIQRRHEGMQLFAEFSVAHFSAPAQFRTVKDGMGVTNLPPHSRT